MYNQSGIESFLKGYYYNRLVELYRESPLDDSYYPITVNPSGKKPMQVYPKLPEYLNGRAGTFLGLSTLSSSWKNEGSSYSNQRLGFQKMTVSEDKKNRSVSFTFYITKKNFVAAFGYDLNTFYVRQAIRELPQSQAAAIWSTAAELFKKEFTNTKPRFLFKSGRFYNDMQKLHPDRITLTDWQKHRGKFEKDYSEATFRAVDADLAEVVNEYGYAVTKAGVRIEDSDEAQARLTETAYILITVTDDYVYPTLGLENSLFVSGEERDNVYGYLTIKKLTQTLKDNYVSKSYSNSWLETDLENQPTEYVSFGDDRNISVKIRNVLLEDKTGTEAVYEKMRLTAKEERKHDSETITLDKYGRILTGSGYSQFVKTSTPEDQGLKPIYKKVPENPVVLDSEGAKSLRWSADGKTYFISDDIDVYYSADGDIILSVPPTRAHTGDITDITLVYKVMFILVRRTFLYFTNISSAFTYSGYRTAGSIAGKYRVSRPQVNLLAIIKNIARTARIKFSLKKLFSGYRTSGIEKDYRARSARARGTYTGFRLLGIPGKTYRNWIRKAKTVYSGYRTSGIRKAYKTLIGKAKTVWPGYRTSGIRKAYKTLIGKAKTVWAAFQIFMKNIAFGPALALKAVYAGYPAGSPKTDHILRIWLMYDDFRILFWNLSGKPKTVAAEGEASPVYYWAPAEGQDKKYSPAFAKPECYTLFWNLSGKPKTVAAEGEGALQGNWQDGKEVI